MTTQDRAALPELFEVLQATQHLLPGAGDESCKVTRTTVSDQGQASVFHLLQGQSILLKIHPPVAIDLEVNQGWQD